MSQRGRARDTDIAGHRYLDYLQSLDGGVALWPLAESSGSNAGEIISGNNGTHANVTLANAIHPAGTPVPYYNGTTASTEIYSAGLNSVFNPLLGTAIIWCKFDGTWGDTNFYIAIQIGADLNNRLLLYKPNVANSLQWYHIAGGVAHLSLTNTNAPTGWFMMGITWDKAGNKARAFYNGGQQGADQAYGGTWAGALTTAWTGIGDLSGGSLWKGWFGYAFLANQAYSVAQMADIYNRGLRQ